MARLTSEIFVSALIRRIFAEGGMAAVERKGAAEAGAIHIRVRHRDGTETLLSPAPMSMFEDRKPLERLFERRRSRAAEWDVSEVLGRERDFDPDIWVVEIETDHPEDYVTVTEPD